MKTKALLVAVIGFAAIGNLATAQIDKEQAFIAAIESAKASYQSAANDMVRGAIRPARAAAICRALGNMTAVSNWVGVVTRLSSTSYGKGVVSVAVGIQITLSTASAEFSDVSPPTVIDTGSALFGKATTLRVGQKVAFSGEFIRDQTDCIYELSLTLGGSITDPEFRFRFTDIGPY